MDSNYTNALQSVLLFEGGYVNDPNDHGGATNKGITQTVYDEFRKSIKQKVRSVKLITDDEVHKIYYTNYWKSAKCDVLPAGVDQIHFDTAVNCGVKQANKFLQRTVGVTDDGIIGPKTLTKIHAADPKIVVKSYVNNRAGFYVDLVARDVSQLKFLKGWINRVISFA